MEPDFTHFARVWISRDQRLSELIERNPEAAEPLIARLAQALANRRQSVAAEQDEGVTFNVDATRLDGRTGVDSDALDEMAQTLASLLRESTPPRPPSTPADTEP